MFGTMRRNRRSTQMKSELNQSVDHFKRAAALAAQETSATVGPRFYAARGRVQPAAVRARGAATTGWDSTLAALTPLIAAAAETLRQSGKDTAQTSKKSARANKKSAKKLERSANRAMGRKTGRRGSKLFSLALVGAAVGAGTAYAMRRRKAAQWDEYEPSAPISSTQQAGGADDAAFEPSDAVGNTTTTGTTTSGTTTAGTTTAGTGAVAAADPALTEEKTDTTAVGDTALASNDTADQTSSPQHSPNVARMASGHSKE